MKGKFQQRQKRSKDHPLAKMSWDYSLAALDWLRKNPSIKEKENELNQAIELGILAEVDANIKATSIKDCVAIIEWYVHFIHVKLIGAVRGKAEDDNWEAENGSQHDFDGSAKIALIAIE